MRAGMPLDVISRFLSAMHNLLVSNILNNVYMISHDKATLFLLNSLYNSLSSQWLYLIKAVN